MFEFLNKLRQKPQRVQTKIAFVVALLVSGLVLVVWLTAVYPELWADKARRDKVSNLQRGPIDTVGGIFKDALGTFSQQLSNTKENINSLVSSTSKATSTMETSLDGGGYSSDASSSTTEESN